MNTAAKVSIVVCACYYVPIIRIETITAWVAYDGEPEIWRTWRNFCKPGQQIGEVFMRGNSTHIKYEAPVWGNPGTSSRSSPLLARSDWLKAQIHALTDHVDALWLQADVVHNFPLRRIRNRDYPRSPLTGQSHLQPPEQTSRPAGKDQSRKMLGNCIMHGYSRWQASHNRKPGIDCGEEHEIERLASNCTTE